jgi:hypothetical protein
MSNPVADLAAQLAEVGIDQFTARDYRPATVRHIVLFRFADAATEADRAETEERFRALAYTRRDGEPYILSIESGSQISGEMGEAGFELGFVVSFSSEGDRNFYVGEPVISDPENFDGEHAKFKQFVGPFLADVQVFDFVA